MLICRYKVKRAMGALNPLSFHRGTEKVSNLDKGLVMF